VTPEQIQAAFVSQLEFNQQIQQRIDQNVQAIRGLEQNVQVISRDVAQLVATQHSSDQRLNNLIQEGIPDLVAMIGTLAEGQADLGQRIDQVISEAAQDRQQAAQDRQEIRVAVTQINQAIQRLESANERQERINDFLLREQGLN
jgi:uncharacterized protein YoxC